MLNVLVATKGKFVTQGGRLIGFSCMGMPKIWLKRGFCLKNTVLVGGGIHSAWGEPLQLPHANGAKF